MRPIDGNEVGAKIQAMYIRREIDYGGENEFCRGMRKALRVIEDAPTIESEPVKRGRWIEHPDDIFPLESTIECSVCGEQENVNIHNDNFCPNCGARMRVDNNG